MAEQSGVPVIPGTADVVGSLQDALREARTIGYPVLIKAAAGGGGRGMRLAGGDDELPQAWQTARAEALACFGRRPGLPGAVIDKPRHIEIQLLADHHGQVIHLGDRDCSIQRRNQKILEEAVSPFSDAALRAEMGDAAVRLAQKSGYRSAEPSNFWWTRKSASTSMEMNTRIQVEHPVTEAVTGVNLIQEQIRIAAGEPLALRQDDIVFAGHAMECPSTPKIPCTASGPARARSPACICPEAPGCASTVPFTRAGRSAGLRCPDCQANRPCPDPRAGDRPHAPRPDGVSDQRRADQHRLPPGHPART
jgi:acetyl-CoA carboxylase biotin carboxylase subunit